MKVLVFNVEELDPASALKEQEAPLQGGHMTDGYNSS